MPAWLSYTFGQSYGFQQTYAWTVSPYQNAIQGYNGLTDIGALPPPPLLLASGCLRHTHKKTAWVD